MSRCVVALSAHPDDETLGCGGALLKHAAQGDRLAWVIATAMWRPMFDERSIDQRRKTIDAVAFAYGMDTVRPLGFPTTRLDTLPLGDVVARLREALSEIDPDIIYLVHRGDVHSDHRVLFQAAIAAAKPFRRARPTSIYSFECPSSTEAAAPAPDLAFVPQVYCDISAHIERKLDILSLYEDELCEAPHPRSLEAVRALARWRGAAACVDYAEAFMTVRAFW